MAIVVTYIDDVIANFPTADKWSILHTPFGAQVTSTADIVLFDSADPTDPVAIIGSGTYKSIVKQESA